MLEGEFNKEFGHGRVFCSCGKLISICGCHVNYNIVIKSCAACKKEEDKVKSSPQPKTKLKTKAKGGTE